MGDLKHILPIEANYTLKHLKERIQQIVPAVEESTLASDHRVFLLDVPAYGNIGDQAIAFAMESFIADILPEYKQIEITENQLPASIKWLKKTIRDNDIICLTGGGNMGVIYQRYESVRRLVLKSFPKNPIVIFPQTFDYGSDSYSKKELERAKQVYGAVKKLVLCARDEESYMKMQVAFPKAKVIFCPDIVLYLDYRNTFKKTDSIGICLRNDKERVLTDAQQDQLYEMYPKHCKLTTMDETELPITHKNRRTVVERKLREFGEKRLILTDRLHGTIFAFITGTPCIAFPNTNGKVERVCKYLSENGNVLFTDNVETEFSTIVGTYGTIRDRFDELTNAVRSIANR